MKNKVNLLVLGFTIVVQLLLSVAVFSTATPAYAAGECSWCDTCNKLVGDECRMCCYHYLYSTDRQQYAQCYWGCPELV